MLPAVAGLGRAPQVAGTQVRLRTDLFALAPGAGATYSAAGGLRAARRRDDGEQRWIMRTMAKTAVIGGLLFLAGIAADAVRSPARADMALSRLVLDFKPGQPPRDDVEVSNGGTERLYVVVEPSEIIAPGLPGEKRVSSRDPQQLGLLVTPAKLVIEPGQRKLVRIVGLGEAGATDRIYRVTFKPVIGELKTDTNLVKVMVGYDVLVIRRPAQPRAVVSGARTGRTVAFANTGNTSAEIMASQQCDAQGKACVKLPGKRLYAGATWRTELPMDTPVQYSVLAEGKATARTY
jgi:P pilus assembly chaperone PapD